WVIERVLQSLLFRCYKMSKQLKKDGFKFVEPAICYAHMQATGMVNDHLTDCFRYREINEKERR
ncbi:MAG: DNA-3-methyladenine glycosylase I, partial [Balneolaceae bacterium]